LSHIRAELSALTRLTNDNERDRLAALNNVVEQKLIELQQTVDLRARNGFAAALDIVQTDRGKLLMDQMRTDLSGILAQEEKAAQAARDHLESSAVVLQWVTILGSLTLVALLLAAQMALRTANAKQLRLIAELQSSRNDSNARMSRCKG